VDVDPTRVCELLVGLPEVNVLGVIDDPGGALRVVIETREPRPACAGCVNALIIDSLVAEVREQDFSTDVVDKAAVLTSMTSTSSANSVSASVAWMVDTQFGISRPPSCRARRRGRGWRRRTPSTRSPVGV